MFKSKVALAVALTFMTVAPAAAERDGVIAHIVAKPGQRDALIEALRPMVGMKGCIDLVVAKDPKNPDAIWLTELWESKELHDAAGAAEPFKSVMANIRPLLVGIDQNYTTVPVFGTAFK